MNTKQLWEYQIRKAQELIKELSDLHGGDEEEWLKYYTYEFLEKNRDNLVEALKCLRELIQQAKELQR